MKNLRQLPAAVVLTILLHLSVFAGEIHTGVVSPPPPPPQSSVMDGQMETPLNADEAASLSPGAEIGLSLLQSVLALF